MPSAQPHGRGGSVRPRQKKGARSGQQAGSRVGQEKASSIRTCLACGVKVNKNELVRFVVFDGVLALDGKQVVSGRGAYCCRKVQCYQRFVKQRKKLAWALRYREKEELGYMALRQGLDADFASCLV